MALGIATESVTAPVLEVFHSVWVELCFVIFFALGFAAVRRLEFAAALLAPGGRSGASEVRAKQQARARKSMEAALCAGSAEPLLTTWRASKGWPLTHNALRGVVQALLDLEPEKLVSEMFDHLAQHETQLGNTRTVSIILDVVVRSGRFDALPLLEQIVRAMQERMHLTPTPHMFEVLISSFAAAGDEVKVAEILAEATTAYPTFVPRHHSQMVRGFLRRGRLPAAYEQLVEMKQEGISINPGVVQHFTRVACDGGCVDDVLAMVGFGDQQRPNKESLLTELPAESVVLVLEDCLKRGKHELALQVEEFVRQTGVTLLPGAYDALLRSCASIGDSRALQLFVEMEDSGIRIHEGLCVSILARCADSKFLRLAEEVVRYARARSMMSIAVYSGLMKVYAYSGMYGKACDLYEQILADGLTPDITMYGCLMKFSVECGRTQLSRELSEKVPQLDLQKYMSLIRAAGRDKDVGRAFELLRTLNSSGREPDSVVYNCVIDVCVSAGTIEKAREVVEEMRGLNLLDVVTYNTLLKGHSAAGDLEGCKKLLNEMAEAGFPPNDVSFNCVINAAASSGNMAEAWETIDKMESAGYAVDHYTISIMMKSLKKLRGQKEVHRVLSLLDRSGESVWSDEILLNTVLETCIRNRQDKRLEDILAGYDRETSAGGGRSLWPNHHTYASLIKACSTLKRVNRCWDIWREMVDVRRMVPNEVVWGCMLDALVCNSRVEEAVKLFYEWKDTVPPNTIIFSTIIKGFAVSSQASRAMTMWREMRKDGVVMNTVVYNALIDAQARMGDVEAVTELFARMREDNCVPDVITYSTAVKGYSVKGDLDRAMEIFKSMKENGMLNDSITYNTILDGCVRHNRMEIADQLLEEMERTQVRPSNYTVGILVRMYGRRRQLDKAFEVVRELPQKWGLVPNAQAKACLMYTCLNNGAMEKAFGVFEELKGMGPYVEAKVYGPLIGSCVRKGMLDRAVELVDEAYGLQDPTRPGLKRQRRLRPGDVLDPEGIEQLLVQLERKGLGRPMALPLMERLRAAGVPISSRFFATVSR